MEGQTEGCVKSLDESGADFCKARSLSDTWKSGAGTCTDGKEATCRDRKFPRLPEPADPVQITNQFTAVTSEFAVPTASATPSESESAPSQGRPEHACLWQQWNLKQTEASKSTHN